MPEQIRISKAVKQATDPLRLIQRVADQTQVLIPSADGVFIALWDEGSSLSYVCGAGFLQPYVGLKLDVSDSLSGLCARTRQVLRSDDTRVDARADAEACSRLGVLSVVCVPLIRGQKTFGVMNVSAQRVGAFDTSDELVLAGLADFVSVVVGAASDLDRVTGSLVAEWTDTSVHGPLTDVEATSRFVANVLTPNAADDLAARERIERALEPLGFNLVFQPIIDLEDGRCHGYEALARFPEEPARPPDLWFAEAHSVGLGQELELAAVKAAFGSLDSLPRDALVAVNVGPQALTSPDLAGMLAQLDARRVVVELTEHVAIADYPCVIQAVATLREMGARLAIDDTGSGVSSLAHILKLAPDVIKLDRALTTGIDRDPVRRALATSLVRFAEDTGPRIVAEGIETTGELSVLRNLGIRYGQGYLLGRPAPLSEFCSSPLPSRILVN